MLNQGEECQIGPRYRLDHAYLEFTLLSPLHRLEAHEDRDHSGQLLAKGVTGVRFLSSQTWPPPLAAPLPVH